MIPIQVSSPRRRRRGVSLMEVLFAIGITLTGLLGVIALLPVAAHYAAKGLRLDQASAVGINAVHEVEIRGMADPTRWRMWEPKPDPYSGNTSSPPTSQPAITLRANGIIAPGESFCLDPRFVAFHSVPTWANNSRLFPYGLEETSGRPAMWRITLSARPGFPQSMSTLQADDIFMSQDDLAYSEPDDATLPPLQQYGNNAEKRQYEGKMSWFATLVPRLSQQRTPNDPNSNVFDSNDDRDVYTLSVVVLFERDAAFEIIPLPPASIMSPFEGTSPNERVTDVVQFYGGFDGGGGGDLQLGGRTLESVEVQEGDWLMLCRFVDRKSGGHTAYFRWYRVATTDEEATEVAPGVWYTRDVSLIGPDWDTRPLSPPVLAGNQNYPPALAFTSLNLTAASQVTTQAVLVKGVVSVFEKTVRLESSSLWKD